MRRLVLAYQRRPLSDAKFQSLTHNRFTKLSGEFWFVVAAHSVDPAGDEERIVGTIFVYWSRKSWRSHEDGIRENVLAMHRAGIDLNGGTTDAAQPRFDNALRHAEATADAFAKFELMRTGDVFFSRPSVRDPEIERRSVEFAGRWKRDFHRELADQCYFFLRDISHKHQHHPAGDDTVLILQERDKEEFRWRKLIIFSLYYFIIGAKRADGPQSHIKALGILSYCKSFQENCRRRLPNANFPIFNDDALSSSIEARIREDEATLYAQKDREDRRTIVAGSVRNYTLSIVAICLSIVALLVQPHITPQEAKKFSFIYNLSEWATDHIEAILLSAIAAGLLVWIGTSRRVLQNAFGTDVLETSNTNRPRSILILVAFGSVVLASTLWYDWKLVRTAVEAALALAKIINP